MGGRDVQKAVDPPLACSSSRWSGSPPSWAQVYLLRAHRMVAFVCSVNFTAQLWLFRFALTARGTALAGGCMSSNALNEALVHCRVGPQERSHAPVPPTGRRSFVSGDGRVVGDRGEDSLDLERCQAGVLRQDPCDEAAHVRRGKAIARGDRLPAVLPADRDVDAPGAPLDRWRRVVEERSRARGSRARRPRRPMRRSRGRTDRARC